MSSGSVLYHSNNMFPLSNSILFERPYLSIMRNQQKKKKPQFSKLSILTKSSIGSTKVGSNEYKKPWHEKQNTKKFEKSHSHQASIKSKKKGRSNSHENKFRKNIKNIQIQNMGMSFEQGDFCRIKQTPISKTMYKRNQPNSISPMYSSLIFNSVERNLSPEVKEKELKNILDRTFNALSSYKEECVALKKQRDFFKKKYYKTSAKLKKVERSQDRSRF